MTDETQFAAAPTQLDILPDLAHQLNLTEFEAVAIIAPGKETFEELNVREASDLIGRLLEMRRQAPR
jgi:hypothetical protein